MVMKKTKDHSLTCRLTPDMRREFINKSAGYGGTSIVFRDLVAAFVAGTVSIKPLTIKGKINHVE